MLFAETSRLRLRSLEKNELPRLVELLDVWDIARWLVVLPYPYTQKNAEEFYEEMSLAEADGDPQFFALALKENNLLIGGVGIHPPRGRNAADGDLEIGYWLGTAYWRQGYMSEAAPEAVSLGFARPATKALVATTAKNNTASEKILQKLGLCNMGLGPRDYAALRGDDEVVKWRLTREEWEKRPK